MSNSCLMCRNNKGKNTKFCSQKCYWKFRKGKTFEELFGIEKAKKIKEKQSQSLMGHPVSKETRKKISRIEKGRKLPKRTKEWKEKHKGRQIGRVFSEETKRKMSKAKKGKYLGKNNHFFGKHHSKETREKISKSRIGKPAPPRSRYGKSGLRKDLGCFFRSTWEANFARVLNYWGFKWKFEPKRFYFKDHNFSYLPDFYLPKDNLYIEISSYYGKQKLEKLSHFINFYLKEQITLIGPEVYKDIYNEFKDKIPNWEMGGYI